MKRGWKNLLRGGFAYDTADFACHPCDARRAREMFFLAKRQGACLDDVLQYAREYLEEKCCQEEFIDKQVGAVEKFWCSQKFQRRKKKAWIVKWGPERDSNKIEMNDIIAIFDSRRTNDFVKTFIHNYYLSCKTTVEEKIHYSSHPRDFPYKIYFDGQDWMMKFGDNDAPLIVAFWASTVIFDESTGNICWKVFPKPTVDWSSRMPD